MTEANEDRLVSVEPVRDKKFQINCTVLYNAYDSAVFEVKAAGPNEALKKFKDYDNTVTEAIHSETEHWEWVEDYRDDVTLNDIDEVD